MDGELQVLTALWLTLNFGDPGPIDGRRVGKEWSVPPESFVTFPTS